MKKTICLLAIILIGSSLSAMDNNSDHENPSQEPTWTQEQGNRYSGVYTQLINNLRENPVPRHGWRDVVWPQRNKIHAYNEKLENQNPETQLLNHSPHKDDKTKFNEYHNPPQPNKPISSEEKEQLLQHCNVKIEGKSQTIRQQLLEETNTAKNTISNQGRLYKIQSSVYSVFGLAGLGYFFYKTKDSSLPKLTFQAVLSSLKDNLKNNTSAFIYGGLGFFGLCNAARSYKTAQEYNKANCTHESIQNSFDENPKDDQTLI